LSTKKTNTRFAIKSRVGEYDSPLPGSVVDNTILGEVRYNADKTVKKYDFFLISQQGNGKSVTPTKYSVIYDNGELGVDTIEYITFKTTHTYFNWSASIRTPSVCQYAKKLTELVAHHVIDIPSDKLSDKLHFL